jgi:hypothetical protein
VKTKVLLLWMQSLLAKSVQSMLYKYQWIQIKTLHQYYNYCEKNNSSLIDMNMKSFSQTLTKLMKVKFHGVVFSERRRINSSVNKQTAFILMLDYGSKVGNNIKYYRTLQCDNISKLLLSPVESSPKTERATPTLSRSNLSMNKMCQCNKINQDKAEGINNKVGFDPLNSWQRLQLHFIPQWSIWHLTVKTIKTMTTTPIQPIIQLDIQSIAISFHS